MTSRPTGIYSKGAQTEREKNAPAGGDSSHFAILEKARVRMTGVSHHLHCAKKESLQDGKCFAALLLTPSNLELGRSHRNAGDRGSPGVVAQVNGAALSALSLGLPVVAHCRVFSTRTKASRQCRCDCSVVTRGADLRRS